MRLTPEKKCRDGRGGWQAAAASASTVPVVQYQPSAVIAASCSEHAGRRRRGGSIIYGYNRKNVGLRMNGETGVVSTNTALDVVGG